MAARKVAQRTSTELCTRFGRLLGWYTVYTFSGALAPNGILPGAKFTLRPNLAFSYCHYSLQALRTLSQISAVSGAQDQGLAVRFRFLMAPWYPTVARN